MNEIGPSAAPEKDSNSLERLIAEAREASPATRVPDFRDRIAAIGEAALEPMTEWLSDHTLAAFAIRVLQRIALQPEARDSVIATLRAVDREELPPHLAGDINEALRALGVNPARTIAPRRRGPDRPVGRPGVEGRGYWVMRTSQWERPFVWQEAQQGRLRQGWGWSADQNLDVITEVRRRGGQLSEGQGDAIRAMRMNTSDPNGMRLGDVVVAPNLPTWGRLSVFRVTGSYRYEMVELTGRLERFGHILPVELLTGDIDRRSPRVSDGLRAMLRPQTRLYNITGYGGDVEALLGNHVPAWAGSDRSYETWSDRDYELLFGRFPPTGGRPPDDQVNLLAAEMGRSFDAITWQWSDGNAYCDGRSASTTSEALRRWLDMTGSCG